MAYLCKLFEFCWAMEINELQLHITRISHITILNVRIQTQNNIYILCNFIYMKIKRQAKQNFRFSCFVVKLKIMAFFCGGGIGYWIIEQYSWKGSRSWKTRADWGTILLILLVHPICSPAQNFVFCSECNGNPLEIWEQKSDMVWFLLTILWVLV